RRGDKALPYPRRPERRENGLRNNGAHHDRSPETKPRPVLVPRRDNGGPSDPRGGSGGFRRRRRVSAPDLPAPSPAFDAGGDGGYERGDAPADRRAAGTGAAGRAHARTGRTLDL